MKYSCLICAEKVIGESVAARTKDTADKRS
jgi:hypothetical protein